MGTNPADLFTGYTAKMVWISAILEGGFCSLQWLVEFKLMWLTAHQFEEFAAFMLHPFKRESSFSQQFLIKN